MKFLSLGLTAAIILAVSAAGATAARADVFNLPAGETSLQFVTVGNPGNQADPLTGFGAVPYTYQMGKFDVTVAQYTAMLNAVAESDPIGLYNGSMAPASGFASCGIVRSGTAGNYSYSFAPANANFPVNGVTFGDALRFANWLTNGQPDTGVEGLGTTETGSYTMNGALTDKQLNAVVRSPDATYVIPSVNEFYKSAYYKGGSENAGYWLYPTQSDSPPTNVLSPTNTNGANYDNGTFSDPVNILTQVGAFSASPGPYGTYDQGGGVFQWTEEKGIGQNSRVILGGAFAGGVSNLESISVLASAIANGIPPSTEAATVGFRIAEVPEPGSVAVMVLTMIGLLPRRRRK
jgi:formylglycine-generating enzyme